MTRFAIVIALMSLGACFQARSGTDKTFCHDCH